MPCADCGRPLFSDGAEEKWCMVCLRLCQHRLMRIMRSGVSLIPQYVYFHGTPREAKGTRQP